MTDERRSAATSPRWTASGPRRAGPERRERARRSPRRGRPPPRRRPSPCPRPPRSRRRCRSSRWSRSSSRTTCPRATRRARAARTGGARTTAARGSRTRRSTTRRPSCRRAPGVPRWSWTSLALRWSGPVGASQRLHLYLLSPVENLLLAFLRAALLVLLLLRLFPWTQRLFPRGWAPPPVAADRGRRGAAPRARPAPAARADIPEQGDARGAPASGSRVRPRACRRARRARACRRGARRRAARAHGGRRERADGGPAAGVERPVDARPRCCSTASPPAVWRARPTASCGSSLETGAHQILLEGAMPDRESVQLALHMKPHRVEVSSDGWTVAGVHEDGLADDDLAAHADPRGGRRRAARRCSRACSRRSCAWSGRCRWGSTGRSTRASCA